jgi:ribosomal protein L37AE/L43A
LGRPGKRKEVIKTRKMKCCPKCGSTNINPLVFYRPSIWHCLDCGYEGAVIIEGGELEEKMQECYRRGCNIIDWTEGAFRMGNWDGSTDNLPKILEDHVKSFAAAVEDNDMGLKL